MIRSLHEQGVADFCELMVDNFVHLPAEAIRQALPDIPLSLHIVSSRFLERKKEESCGLASYLRDWARALQPMYVSDHLASYQDNGRYRPMLAELAYERQYQQIKENVLQWQAQLDMPVLFENYASITVDGSEQAKFFKRLQHDIGVGLLFDISNAYLAEQNNMLPLSAWHDLIAKTSHFHVGGFRKDSQSGLLIDTHDIELASELYPVIQQVLAASRQSTVSIVVEFDANQNEEEWRKIILKIKKWGV